MKLSSILEVSVVKSLLVRIILQYTEEQFTGESRVLVDGVKEFIEQLMKESSMLGDCGEMNFPVGVHLQGTEEQLMKESNISADNVANS